MTRPTLPELQPYLPPPKDLTRLSDGELARFLEAMAIRYNDGCSDHAWRLMAEAAKRLRTEGESGIF